MSKQAAKTISVEQLGVVAEAFDLLYDVLTDMPAFIGDFYETEEYRTIGILNGEEYSEADWMG